MRRLLLLSALTACEISAPPAPDTPAPAPHGPVRFVGAGAGDVPPLVTAALADSGRDQRRLLVYVGAAWCEPCRAFHEAAARGELDAALPGLTLLEFDADRDDARLRAAGYKSDLIPLFAVPGPDGRASGRATSGAKRGGDYVAELAPRVGALLVPTGATAKRLPGTR